MAFGLRRASATTLGLTFLAGLWAASCSGSPDRQKALREVGSWAATAQLIAQARLAGSITAPYAAQTLRAGARQIEEQSQSLRTARLEPSLRTRALETAVALRSTLATMSVAAEDSSRVALARHLPRLDSLARAAKALSRSAEPQ